MKLRDYQVEAVANVFRIFGIPPAGPDESQVVKQYRLESGQRQVESDGSGDGLREDDLHGSTGEPLADRSSDDDQPPV